ncbi:MAG: hypothetical protein JJT88_11200 [Gammaproteobacteria bacterium]|nr:hypothetical protein [Gammaproteobacteria bacterium]
MLQAAKGWSNHAFNQVPDSRNRIHSDDMAEAYGYTGALVPGVTVSACLIHPAVVAWGMDWLSRGHAHVTIKSPLYDAAPFEVVTQAEDEGYRAELVSEERLCAVAEISLPEVSPPAPQYRGDPMLPDDHQPPAATREHFEVLRETGCPAACFRWSAENPMATYLRDPTDVPTLLRVDTDAGSGYANAAFLLGCANWHFASVAYMNPWIHLETRSWNHAPVALGTELLSEMTVVDLFERKGHAFADCTFHLFRADTKHCVSVVEQRAIYRMRSA